MPSLGLRLVKKCGSRDQIRDLHKLQDQTEKAARFIYLMKTCYNGLWRVNKNNEFNTPIGSYKNPNICNEENILAASSALQKAEIKYQSFTQITPQKGDFVYFDPPYHPTAQDSFLAYINEGFSEKAQKNLSDLAIKLTKAKVNIMISNSDTEFIEELYKSPNFNILKVEAPRVVNCKADKRQSVSEILIKNY